MTQLTATSWETQGIQALWAYACLNFNAGALGLLAVEVNAEPSHPRAWTDGRVLKVSRVALHDWLAQEDIGQGARALANAGLLTLEEWLREGSGWAKYASEGTSPVVSLPEGEWAPEFGRAVRHRLRHPRQPVDSVNVPTDLQSAFEAWVPPSQGWGRGEVDPTASIQGLEQTWTVSQALRQWRVAQCDFRHAHGPLEFPEEMALTEAFLKQHPDLVELWLDQVPVPKAPWNALFQVRDPRWVPTLISGGARADAEHLGEDLLSWAALHAPQLIPAFLNAGVPLVSSEERLFWHLAIFEGEDEQELEHRRLAGRLLLDRMGQELPTQAFLTNTLSRAFYPGHNRLRLLQALWPEGHRLEAVYPTLEHQQPNGQKEALPLAEAMAVLMVEALEQRGATFEETAASAASLANMGVDFSATFANGDTVFHRSLSFARAPKTAQHLYFSLTPLGADWNRPNDLGQVPMDLPHSMETGKIKQRQRDSMDLRAIESDLEQKRLDRTLQESAASKPKQRL